MTILQNASFQGIQTDQARPGAFSYKSGIEKLLKDQAYAYESIAGVKVADASAIAATPHVHDGVTGAPLRLPLIHQWLGTTLDGRTSKPVSGGTDYAGFSPFIWTPFYCPSGIDEMLLCLWVDPSVAAARDQFQASTWDTSFNLNGFDPSPVFIAPDDDGLEAWLAPAGGGSALLVFRLAAVAGQVNILKCEAWDGYYASYTPDSDAGGFLAPKQRRVDGFCVIPMTSAPVEVQPATTPAITTTAVKVPAAFSSFDSALVQDNRSINSYLLVRAMQNDALLREILTGRPAGNRASATFSGHNHKDDAATSLDDAGADIEHALGAWFYGTIRPYVVEGTSSAYHSFVDVIGNGLFGNAWEGGINAVAHKGNGLVTAVVANHRVRLPAAIAANLADGTGNLKATALVYEETASESVTVDIQIGDENASSFGTVRSGSFTGPGRGLINLSGIESASGERIVTVRVRMAQSQNEVAKVSYLYGLCLYYEP